MNKINSAVILGSGVQLLVCVTGDKICSLSSLQNRHLIRALADNLTHGLVGGIAWWILASFLYPKLGDLRLNQALFCLFLASVIDVDHFLAAGSIHMKDVLNLPHRPPLHCTGLCLFLFGAVLACARFYPGMHLLPWQWLLAFSTHHVRDATRRGLWLVPGLLTTRPLPYGLYLALVVALPLFIAFLVPVRSVPVSRTFIV